MRIVKATFTGADDTTDPRALMDLSRQYPFIEWGILASKTRTGTNRFPSADWLERALHLFHNSNGPRPTLSLHLCGRWVREVLDGNWAFASRFGYLEDFQRIQLNFHAETHKIGEKFWAGARAFQARHFVSMIFQLDGVNDHLIDEALENGLYAYPLYDISGGRGITPDVWLPPADGVLTGYAGGLGPDNLTQELSLIEGVAGDTEIWIDMETHVRSAIPGGGPHYRSYFDLDKVGTCAETVKEYCNGH